MSSNNDIKTYLIALNQIDKVGDKRISELINHYESVENIFEDKEENIKELLEKKFKSQISNFDKNEILDVKWIDIEEIKNMDENTLRALDTNKATFQDFINNKIYPLDIFDTRKYLL